GGFDLLKEKYSNLVETNESILNKDERERYSRQIILKEVGIEGQKKLLDSRVLVVGAGGLGSPILIYLASAGVGTIGIIDPDIVDISNLHRQIIHFNKNIGKSKVSSAKETINLINPNTNVITYYERLSETNALNIISNYDIVIDGTDNFTSKYLINDACFLLKKTNVFGSIFKFDGQVSVFTYKENTPCYRCIFPEISELESIPNCAEAGVIGILAGIV
ncbi:MAG: HesA/MoeB/ThiF family protein, partial [Candidatus Sericytochromatia bacterium]